MSASQNSYISYVSNKRPLYDTIISSYRCNVVAFETAGLEGEEKML